MVKSSSPNAPSTWLIFLRPRTYASPQTCQHSASSVLAVRISRRVIADFVCRKQHDEWRSRWLPTICQDIFLTNKTFLLQVMYRHVRMIFIVKCVTVTWFFIACAELWWKSMIFIVLSSLETVNDTVQYRYCTFSLSYRLLRIRVKRQNSLPSYVRERDREKVQRILRYTLLLLYLMLVMYYRA